MSQSNISTAKGPSTHRVRLAELKDRLATLVDRDTVPSGILRVLPEPGFATAQTAAEVLNKQTWRELYFSLYNGALPHVSMATVDEIEQRAATYREAGAIPIAIGHYDYHAPRPQFLARILAYADRGGTFQLPDPAHPEAVLEPRTVFFASAFQKHEFNLFFPQLPIHYGLTVRYILPADFYFTNTGLAPTAIEIDADDGLGYRPVAFDQAFAVNYTQAGNKQIGVRVSLDGQLLDSWFALMIQPAKAPTPDETWQLTSPITFDDQTTTGHAWVYYGAGHTGLVNPLIVAEGFPGGYSLDYLWSVLNEQNLVGNLLDEGKDVIILGFDDGTNYIEANAGVIIAAIQRAIYERQGDEQLVIGGASMGGLVTRYALAYMETNDLPHETRLYFSFDSPHLGANVPGSVLYFLSFFASTSDFVKQANQQITSLAAQEMLLYWLKDFNHTTIHAPSPLRQTFLDNLQAVGGFASQPRNIGVANGVGTGQGNTTEPGTNALYWSYWDGVGCYLYSAPGEPAGSGYDNLVCEAWELDPFASYCYLKFAGNPAFDSVPGGTNDFFTQLAQGINSAGYGPVTPTATLACFIPVISALAMSTLDLYSEADLFQNLTVNTPPSLLEAFQWDTQNDPHVTVTPGLAAWLLSQINGDGSCE